MILMPKMFSVSVAISLAAFSNIPLIDVELDGVNATLILDTGASHTTFDIAFVTNAFPNAKLEPVMLIGNTNAKNNVPYVFGAKTMKIGELTLDANDAMAFPLEQLSSAVGRRVDGILGMNHLARKPFILSLADAKITWDPPPTNCNSFLPAISRLRGNRRELVAKLPNGETLGLLIDSGSTWTFIEKEHWQITDRQTEVASADLNHRTVEKLQSGEKGTIDCGVKFEVEPMIAPQAGLNQIGSTTLKHLDVLFRGDEIKLRSR